MANKTADDLVNEIQGEHEAMCRLFATSDGQVVLKHLREIYYDVSCVIPNDPYATHVENGKREVILYINEVINNGNKRD